MKITREAFTHRKKGELSALFFNARFLSIATIIAFALIFWWARVMHTDARENIPAGSNMDIYVYHQPMYDYGFGQLKTGKIPLWNPYTSCGTPFLAVYQIALFYPLNFLHWLLRTDLAFSLTYLMHFILAGIFMYLWARRLGCTHTAAAFAGTAYMLCPFVCYPLEWPHYIAAQPWIPAVFLLVNLTFLKSRWTDAVLLGAAVGCQFLAGYADCIVYTLCSAFAYLLYLTVIKLVRREEEPRLFGRSFGFSVLGLTAIPAVLTAIQWLPMLQLWSLSARPPTGLSREAILIGGSLYPSTFLAALVNPASFGWAQYTLYPGLLTVLMAAFAFVNWNKWRELVFFSLLAAGATLVAFGEHTPVFELYLYLPMGSWFRLPSRMLILTAFSIATLAGIGCNHLVDDVLAKPKPLKNATARFVLFLAICVVFLILIPKNGAIFVLALLVGCLLGATGRSATVVGLLCVFLVGLDLMLYISDPVTYPWITRSVFPEMKQERQFLQKIVMQDRMHVFHRKRDWKNFLAPVNFGLAERIRETGGYEALTIQRYSEFCAYLEKSAEPSYETPFTGSPHWTSESVNPRMLNLLGARYIVEDPGRDLYLENGAPQRMPNGFNLRRVFSGKLNVYENPEALPRALYIRKVEVIRDKREILKRLADRSFDYLRTAVLEEEPEPLAAAPEPPAVSTKPSPPELIVKSRSESETDIIADVPDAGFILVNDVYMPGWHARVDGAKSKIYRANYLFMAVPVRAGKHAIELQYKPFEFRAGRWISILAIVGLSLSLAFDFASRRAKEMAPWET